MDSLDNRTRQVIIRHHMAQQRQRNNPHRMASIWDEIPLTDADAHLLFHPQLPHVTAFEHACRGNSLAAVQAIVTTHTCTPAFLHRGLPLAIKAGRVDIASYLLASGAPMTRGTPSDVLFAPTAQQIPLFEVLRQHGWTPNTPGYYGNVLLPAAVTNLPLLRWFLSHGADPNRGPQRPYDSPYERFGESVRNSGCALESAAARGSREAVQLLLDAGADIHNGYPLHAAARSVPPGSPSQCPIERELDIGRIPVMELLVERGADVNQRMETPYVEPRYALLLAAMVGAVERARWLIQHGADPGVEKGWHVDADMRLRRTQ
ncbi:ankyrin repeat-containing domain protein [Aspergillus floccosus]